MTDTAPTTPPALDLDGTARRPDNSAQLIALRLAQPMRPTPGRTADLDGLALFDADRSPPLL